jgi:hypothetical protein
MAEQSRQVELYSVSIVNKVGEGARLLGALRDAGVNLIAVWGYPRGAGRAQFDFIPEDGAAFVAAAKQAKLKVKKGAAFYVQGEDRRGAAADLLQKLAEKKVNVGALQGVSGGAGRYGVVVCVSNPALRKAASALGAG